MPFADSAMDAVYHDMRRQVNFLSVGSRRGLCNFHVLYEHIPRAMRAYSRCCTSVFHVLYVGRMHLLTHSEGNVTLLDDDN